MYYTIVPIMASSPPSFSRGVSVSSILLFRELMGGGNSRVGEGDLDLEFENRST